MVLLRMPCVHCNIYNDPQKKKKNHCMKTDSFDDPMCYIAYKQERWKIASKIDFFRLLPHPDSEWIRDGCCNFNVLRCVPLGWAFQAQIA